jgi:hypothetical protein
MKNQEFFNKISFYFENAPTRTYKQTDEIFIRKIRSYLDQLKPQKIWIEKGITNKYLKVNVFPDFVITLGSKLIACEVEKSNIVAKFDLYRHIKFFDEIWFFTNIPIEKDWLHYKLQNNLKKCQKFFGLNEKGEVVLIKEIH